MNVVTPCQENEECLASMIPFVLYQHLARFKPALFSSHTETAMVDDQYSDWSEYWPVVLVLTSHFLGVCEKLCEWQLKLPVEKILFNYQFLGIGMCLSPRKSRLRSLILFFTQETF